MKQGQSLMILHYKQKIGMSQLLAELMKLFADAVIVIETLSLPE